MRTLSALSNSQRRAHVLEQIQLRLRLLETWLSDGAPDGQRVPTSLNQARAWNDPSLGIVPIGSPATFTTTHSAHGALVTRVAHVLREFAAQRPPPPLGKKKSAAHHQARLAAQDRMLVAAANQGAVKSVAQQETERKLRVIEQSLEAAQSTIGELSVQNQRLTRALARCSSRATVTELHSQRPRNASGKEC